MAILDESLLKEGIINENQYYSIVARMELKTLKEYRYFNDNGKEKKFTKKQILVKINDMLAQKHQPSLTKDWLDKWWKKL